MESRNRFYGYGGMVVECFPSIDDIVVEYAKESFGGRLPPYVLTYRDELGILSLTEEPDNPVMWAHYSCNGTGMVLELFPPALITPGRYKVWGMGGIWPVIYSSKRSYNFEQLDAAALTHEKGMEWSYEREWRMVRRLTECTSVENGRIHLFALNPRAIVSVTLGYKASSAFKQQVIALCRSNAALRHDSIRQSGSCLEGR